jgi:phage FluMu protein gp41
MNGRRLTPSPSHTSKGRIMAHITETLFLTTGVEFDGKLHREITIRIPIVQDSVDIEKETSGSGLIVKSLSMLRKQIVKFGAIPAEKITVDLLGQLTETDLDVLNEATQYLKKKALWQKRD